MTGEARARDVKVCLFSKAFFFRCIGSLYGSEKGWSFLQGGRGGQNGWGGVGDRSRFSGTLSLGFLVEMLVTYKG